MTQEKPSRNEEEYFAKQEAEKLEKRRAEAAAAARAEERHSHYMKCPKCGATLATEEFHGVQIDRCPECHGLWLDAGEIDTVVAHEDPGLLRRVIGDMVRTFRGGGRA
jgi:hypothetical protein